MSRKQKRKADVEPRKYDSSARQEFNLAGPCQACKALLVKANPPREQKTRVYALRNRVRYCRCDNCGNTWKRIIEVKSNGVEQ